MQITFDTTNPKDLEILNQVLALALGEKAQPTVAQNGGTTGAGLDLSPAASGVDESAATAVAPVTEKKVKAKKSVPAAEPATPSAEPESASTSATVASEAKSLSLDEVRAALQSFTASKGVPAGIELLKKYNAGRISELEEANYAAFAADCAA
jgi:hypothetical protein